MLNYCYVHLTVSFVSGKGQNYLTIMEEAEVTFLFQFGLIRDTVSVLFSSLTLKTLKELACDFVNKKVGTKFFL